MGLEASPPSYDNLTLLAQGSDSISIFNPPTPVVPTQPIAGPSKARSKPSTSKSKSKPSETSSRISTRKRNAKKSKQFVTSDEDEGDAKSSGEEEEEEADFSAGSSSDDELAQLSEEPVPKVTRNTRMTRKRKAQEEELNDNERPAQKKKVVEAVVDDFGKGGKRGKAKGKGKEKEKEKETETEKEKEKEGEKKKTGGKEKKEKEKEKEKTQGVRPSKISDGVWVAAQGITNSIQSLDDSSNDSLLDLPIPPNATKELRDLRELVLHLPSSLPEGKDGEPIATSFYNEAPWSKELSSPDSWEHWDGSLNTILQKRPPETPDQFVDKLVKKGPKGTAALYKVLAHVMEHVVDPIMLDGKIMRLVDAIHQK
jgi:hypothetical protein